MWIKKIVRKPDSRPGGTHILFFNRLKTIFKIISTSPHFQKNKKKKTKPPLFLLRKHSTEIIKNFLKELL